MISMHGTLFYIARHISRPNIFNIYLSTSFVILFLHPSILRFTDQTMRNAQLNANGLGDLAKLRSVIVFLRDIRVDLVFICESHLTVERLDWYQQMYGNIQAYTNVPFNNRVGVTWIILSPSIKTGRKTLTFCNLAADIELDNF